MNENVKEPLRLASRLMHLGSVLPLDWVVRAYGGSDKWLHGYTNPYHSHLKALRWRTNRVLEIGVGLHESRSVGGSLRIWRDYFRGQKSSVSTCSRKMFASAAASASSREIRVLQRRWTGHLRRAALLPIS